MHSIFSKSFFIHGYSIVVGLILIKKSCCFNSDIVFLHSIFHHGDASLSKFPELLLVSLNGTFPTKNLSLLRIYFPKIFLKKKKKYIFLEKKIWLLELLFQNYFCCPWDNSLSSLICCNMNVFLKIVYSALNLSAIHSSWVFCKMGLLKWISIMHPKTIVRW